MTAAAALQDGEIESAIRAGDRGKAVALCARHFGASVGRVCMAMTGVQSDAEDLAQETFLAAHDSFDTWRGEGTLRAWLFGIARRRCARHVEKNARQRSRLHLVYDADRAPDNEESAIVRERARRARAALEGVRPSEREALLLRFAGELSFREVGEACGIDEAAARKRVSRALARLRETLTKE